jgi:predicted DNA-binding transcriptional regulator AlpA
MVERTYVTIRKFTGIFGVTRNWYYRHVDDPGMPQRVYFGGKPMLVWEECAAYLDRAVAARKKKTGPRRTKPRLVGHSGEEAQAASATTLDTPAQ